MTVGERIAELRKARGWSQYKLALLSGVPPTTVGRLESGVIASPRQNTLAKVAQALGVSLSELLASTGTMHQETPVIREVDGEDFEAVRREIIEALPTLDAEGLSAMLGVLKVLARRTRRRGSQEAPDSGTIEPLEN